MAERFPSPGDALTTLEGLHREAAGFFAQLSDEELATPATIGGGDWSAKDLLLHIEAWEKLALDALEDWRQRSPQRLNRRFEAAGNIDAFNAQMWEASRDLLAAESRRSAEATHSKLVEALRGVGEDEWNEPPYYEPPRPIENLGDLLGGILGSSKGPFTHVVDHIDDLRSYVDSRVR